MDNLLPTLRASVASPGRPRLLFIGSALVLFFLVLCGRLYAYQIVDNQQYQQIADQERRAQIPIPPRRGALLDTNGDPLVESVQYDSVYALGPLMGDLDKEAAALSPVLGMSQQDIRAKLDKQNQRPVVLKSAVPSAVSQQVDALALPGVYLQQEPIRQYPEGSMAAQILGFVGTDGSGLAGLELSYDSQLAGQPGVIDTEKDTSGQEIVLGRRLLTPPVEGADLVLTLDRYVQRTAERLLNQAVVETKSRGGLIIVMEPSTGNILAVANNPTYSLTADQVYDPNQAQLYKPTIVTNQYEPGSTMKSLTMAAAINEGVVTPGTIYNDTGVANVDGVIIHNWDGNANGRINMTQLLIHSSNVAMQWVAGLMGPDMYYHYAKDVWGFGTPTGIQLPGEVGGTVRTPSDPGWTRVDLATNSYGQGIAVTPLQLITAFSSLANDGVMMQPRLVREIRGPNGVQDLAPVTVRRTVTVKTARTMQQMLTTVGDQDSYDASKVPGFPFALKTGTADTPTNVGYNLALTVGSVVAMFPPDNPRFAVLIRLDGPEALYGGVVAVPVLGKLVQAMATYYRLPPTPDTALPATSY